MKIIVNLVNFGLMAWFGAAFYVCSLTGGKAFLAFLIWIAWGYINVKLVNKFNR